MKRKPWVILFAFVFMGWGVVPGAADETSLSIVSPEDGAVFDTANVPIRTRFVKGVLGDHLHVYVNGAFYKSSKRENLTLWDLRAGDHTIEVRAASREKDEKGVEHKELGVNARVSVTVLSSGAASGTSSKAVIR